MVDYKEKSIETDELLEIAKRLGKEDAWGCLKILRYLDDWAINAE